MSNITEINRLLSGTMTDTEAGNLFGELANSSELRLTFSSYVSVDNAIASSAQKKMPPQRLKNELFNNLGLATPAASIPVSKASSAKAGSLLSSKPWFLLSNLSSLLIGSLIVFYIMYNSTDSYELAKLNAFTCQEAVYAAETVLYNEDHSAVHGIEKSEVTKQNQSVNNTGEHGRGPGYIADAVAVDVNTPSSVPLLINPAACSGNNIRLVTQNHSDIVYGMNSIIEAEPQGLPENIYHMDIQDYASRFSAELRTEESVMFPEPSIAPSKWGRFNKSSVSIMYGLNEDNKLGANLRQETFFLQFRGTEADSMIFEYEMQPNLTSFGLFWRHRIFDSEAFSMYSDLHIGGNAIGAVIRPGLGVSYSPAPSVNLTIGLEYSALLYRRQAEYFAAHKASLFYGFSIFF